jgi:hypothetical protein
VPGYQFRRLTTNMEPPGSEQLQKVNPEPHTFNVRFRVSE